MAIYGETMDGTQYLERLVPSVNLDAANRKEDAAAVAAAAAANGGGETDGTQYLARQVKEMRVLFERPPPSPKREKKLKHK